MKKLNVGLVGAGFMGKAHSIGYSDMPKYFWPAPAVPVLKTICDIVPEIAADAKERFGFEKCCTDWRDIAALFRGKIIPIIRKPDSKIHGQCIYIIHFMFDRRIAIFILCFSIQGKTEFRSQVDAQLIQHI